MSDVIHRTTLEYRQSVNTPDYDAAQWIINPELPDCPQELWEVSGDEVVEMSQSDQAIYYAQKLQDAKTAKKSEVRDTLYAALQQLGYDPFLLVYATDIKNEAAINGDLERASYVGQLRSWIDEGVDILDLAWASIDTCGTEQEVGAVTIDLNNWLASNPQISTRTAREL